VQRAISFVLFTCHWSREVNQQILDIHRAKLGRTKTYFGYSINLTASKPVDFAMLGTGCTSLLQVLIGSVDYCTFVC